MDSIKWSAIFVMSLTCSQSQNPLDNCSRGNSPNRDSCDFDSGGCNWKNVPGNLVNWTRNNRNDYFSFNLITGRLTLNHTSRVQSCWQCTPGINMHLLYFQSHVVSPYYCHLRVYLKTRMNESLIWSTNKDGDFDQSVQLAIDSSDCVFQFQIVFEGVTSGIDTCGDRNEIRIDNICLSQTIPCDLLTTSTPVTPSASPSTTISPIMTTHPSASPSTTISPIMTSQPSASPSTTISPIMTSQPSSTHSSMLTTTYSDSSQRGNYSEIEINENEGTVITPGAIAGIVISILIVVIVIIVIIIYKRYDSDICGMQLMLKHLNIDTKKNSTRLNSSKGELRQDTDEQRPVNNARMYSSDGELEGKKKGYEKPAVPLKPQYYALTHDNGPKGKDPQHASRNCHSNPDDNYNVLHINLSGAQPRPSQNTYDHMETWADHSQTELDQKNEYSLAGAAFRTNEVNFKPKSVGDPVLDDADEYNKLHITNGNYPKGDGHSANNAHRYDLYNHLTTKGTGSDEKGSSTGPLSTSGSIHQYIANDHDCDYNHLNAGQSYVPQSTTVDTYDHVQAMEDYSQTAPVAEYSSADVSFKSGYVNTSVNVAGIVLGNVD